jgi:ferric-dicitrate binding protein FerR (iron transport regulator)
MTGAECYRSAGLAGRGSAALSEAERLRIEDHRASCHRCRRIAALDDRLREMADAALPRTGQRAIERAIEATVSQPVAPAAWPGSRRRWAFAAGVAVAAAAAALALGAATGEIARGIETPALPGPAPGPVARILAAGERTELAHAAVQASADCELRWDPSQRRVELERGSLSIAVTPGTGRSFTVATPSFVVIVLGTELEVDLEGVMVHRGSVEVRSVGGILRAKLGAGDAWTRFDELEPELELHEDLSAPEATPDSRRAPSPAAWLTEGRAHLADRRLERAGQAIRQALDASPSSRQHREAHTLLAEVALLSGQVDRAIRHYRLVASRHPGSLQGEAALFAAARLEARRGRAAAADELLQRYRERYPRGRFADEVERKLQTRGTP